jgi:hypothetical protein
MTDTYTPSQELLDAIEVRAQAKSALEAAETALREVVGRELKAPPEPTNKQVAEGVPGFPWSEETVRLIAREYDVKPKRKPTVRSIKPAKRTPKPGT